MSLRPLHLRSLLGIALLAIGTGACDNPDAIKDVLDRIHDHGGGGAGGRPPPAGGGQEGAMCGGIAGLPCAKGLFCEPPADSCRVADVAGVCRVRPEICPQIFAPVCGCDGKTYGNDCQRQAAAVAKAHDGECARVIEVGEGESCGGFTAPPARVCKAGLFCMQPPKLCGVADAPGICESTPTACTKEFLPVCGCDGVTYGNDCMRRAAQAPLDHPGACAPRGGQEGAMCDGFAGFPCDKGLFCEHPAAECRVADGAGVCRAQPQVCPQIFAPVCGCDGKTYGNDCQRQAAGVSKDHDGACP